jgi:hypothetical protein
MSTLTYAVLGRNSQEDADEKQESSYQYFGRD